MSPEFRVEKIIERFDGTDGVHKPFVIVENAKGERLFIPDRAIDGGVNEIRVYGVLEIKKIDPETGDILEVSQDLDPIIFCGLSHNLY